MYELLLLEMIKTNIIIGAIYSGVNHVSEYKKSMVGKHLAEISTDNPELIKGEWVWM